MWRLKSWCAATLLARGRLGTVQQYDITPRKLGHYNYIIGRGCRNELSSVPVREEHALLPFTRQRLSSASQTAGGRGGDILIASLGKEVGHGVEAINRCGSDALLLSLLQALD
jgi:hypothetical protein